MSILPYTLRKENPAMNISMYIILKYATTANYYLPKRKREKKNDNLQTLQKHQRQTKKRLDA
jgi:hypothetical protein